MAIAHVGTIMDAISHGLGRSEDESSRSNLTRAGKVAFPSPEPPNSSFNAARKQIREVKYKDTDGCHSECLRSEPSISGWTRRSQDFHIFTSQTTRPVRKLLALFQDSSGNGDGVDACFDSYGCPQLLPAIPIYYGPTL
jgi:hypothetical protein